MRRTAPLALFALVCGLVTLAAPAEAATGLDPTYGDDGVATLLGRDSGGELGPAFSFFGDIDPLGRVVRAALSHDQVVRFDVQGQLDPTFGDGGIADVPDGVEPVIVDATANGIVVGVELEGSYGIVKLSDDGEIDETFGDAGLVLVSESTDDLLTDVDLDPEGRVTAAVVGHEIGSPLRIHRFAASGDVDEAFGDEGTITRTGEDLDARTFESLDADATGLVFVRHLVGDPETLDEGYEIIVERVDLEGQTDATFGVGGESRLPGGALSMEIDESDGSIFLGGVDDDGPAVWRLRPDGRVDAAFSDRHGAPAGGDGPVHGVAALGQGRVAAIAYGSDASVAVVLGPDGEPDPGFGAGGTQIVPGSVELAGAIGSDGAGRVIAFTNAVDDESLPAQHARAYLTDFADLAPAITEVTPYETSLSVEWVAPEDEGEHPIRIYHLVALQGGEVAGQSVVAGDLRQASIEGLDPFDESYDVLIQPYDDFGPRLTTEVVEVAAAESVLPAVAAPAVPGVEVAAGRRSATVSWDALQDDGGSTIWGYAVVAVQKSGGALAAWRNVRADVRTTTLPELTNGVAHDLYVFAVTSEGFGAVGTPVAVTPTGVAPAAQAPQVSWASVVPVGPSAIVTWGPTLEWGEPTWAVHVIVIEEGAMTQWRAMTEHDRQVVVPAAEGAQVYVVAQSASGFGPLTGSLAVG